jgi:hypothetical protein
MPAPTIAPTPIAAAWRTFNALRGDSVGSVLSFIALSWKACQLPRVAMRMALNGCSRFSAWSNTMLAADSKTSPVTSRPEVLASVVRRTIQRLFSAATSTGIFSWSGCRRYDGRVLGSKPAKRVPP